MKDLTRSFACPCAAADYRDEMEAKGFRGVVLLLTDDGLSIVSVKAPATHGGLVTVGGLVASAAGLMIAAIPLMGWWVATP